MSHAQSSGHAAPQQAPTPIPLRPAQVDVQRTAVANAASGAPIHVAHVRGHFHPLPVIGHAEAFYVKHVQQAEAAGDPHAKAAYKVGQHVTSALDPKMPWDQKLKRFNHVLGHYCVVPVDADSSLQMFYGKLGDLVRRHAGQEALHSARKHHEEYLRRLKAGEARDKIEEDAEVYFFDLCGHAGCPAWCSKEAWGQITAWRDHWV